VSNGGGVALANRKTARIFGIDRAIAKYADTETLYDHPTAAPNAALRQASLGEEDEM
jgi:hypothetical protein